MTTSQRHRADSHDLIRVLQTGSDPLENDYESEPHGELARASLERRW